MGIPRLNEILRLARGFKPRETLPGAVKAPGANKSGDRTGELTIMGLDESSE